MTISSRSAKYLLTYETHERGYTRDRREVVARYDYTVDRAMREILSFDPRASFTRRVFTPPGNQRPRARARGHAVASRYDPDRDYQYYRTRVTARP